MKKIVIAILTLLLVGCVPVAGNNPIEIKNDYIQLLKDFEVREKNISNTIDNPEFDKFLDKIFVEGMETDFLNMHFNVIDYKAYNIKKPEVNLGKIEYGIDVEAFERLQNQLDELLSFDYDSLSYRQQYDYENLEYSNYESLAMYSYYQYSFLFTSGSNLAENLISNFTDYTFYDEESIEDYLTCLADVDRLFNDALKYTKQQSDDGFGMIDPWVEYTVEVCDGVLNKVEGNAFIVTFDERIDKLDFIDASKKQQYKDNNKKLVIEEVLPAYEKLADEIEQYMGKVDIEDAVLYKRNKEYAELTYMLKSSNNLSIDETFKQLQDHLAQLETDYISCFYDEDSYNKVSAALYGQVDSLNLVSEDCLEFLRKNLYFYYPELGEVKYDIQELDPDTAPATAIAYYWPSPIDNSNQNIIRTNPNNMVPGYSTYTTLAHEGFPGHLYQHVYYAKTNPHNYRSVIGYIGYTEGWAVNSQKYAYYFSGIDSELAANCIYFESTNYFPLYSLIDIGVNYYGWTAKDIVDYFEENSMIFQFSEQDAAYYREILIEMPGVYCSYGLGSCNFAILEQYAKEATRDAFDYVKYHDALMKNGPLPFNILKGAVDEFIDGQLYNVK